jgi:hypothetical protein
MIQRTVIATPYIRTWRELIRAILRDLWGWVRGGR